MKTARLQQTFCAVVVGAVLLRQGAAVQAAAAPGACGLEPLVAAFLAAADDDVTVQPPEAVSATVKQWFPQASLVTFGKGQMNGVPCYSILLRQAEKTASMAIAADGSVGRIRLETTLEGLPAEEQARVLVVTGNGHVCSIETRLRLGIARQGTFVAIDEPTGCYEVKYLRGQNTRVATVPLGGPAVLATLARVRSALGDSAP